MTPTTRVEAVDASIAELRSRLPEIEEARRAAEADATTKRKMYESLLEARYIGDDDVDDAVVAQAYDEHQAAQRLQDEAGIALNRILGRLRELEDYRAEAERADAEAALLTQSEEFEAIGAELDRALAAAAKKMEPFIELSLRAMNLRRRAGLSSGERTPKSMAVDAVHAYFAWALTPAIELPRNRNVEQLGFSSIARSLSSVPERKEHVA